MKITSLCDSPIDPRFDQPRETIARKPSVITASIIAAVILSGTSSATGTPVHDRRSRPTSRRSRSLRGDRSRRRRRSYTSKPDVDWWWSTLDERSKLERRFVIRWVPPKETTHVDVWGPVCWLWNKGWRPTICERHPECVCKIWTIKHTHFLEIHSSSPAVYNISESALIVSLACETNKTALLCTTNLPLPCKPVHDSV